jgi:hypothetical protein
VLRCMIGSVLRAFVLIFVSSIVFVTKWGEFDEGN